MSPPISVRGSLSIGRSVGLEVCHAFVKNGKNEYVMPPITISSLVSNIMHLQPSIHPSIFYAHLPITGSLQVFNHYRHLIILITFGPSLVILQASISYICLWKWCNVETYWKCVLDYQVSVRTIDKYGYFWPFFV